MDAFVYDDDPLAAELMASVLRELGLGVEKYLTGQDAVQLIAAAMPKLVVLDIMMPGMDGLTICATLKSNPKTSGIKVLVVSGKPFGEDKEDARQCGADAFLTKPYELKSLAALVRGLLPGAGAPGAGPKPRQVRPAMFQARVWGCHGPAGAKPPHFTPCVVLDFGGREVVLDAGSGLGVMKSNGVKLSKDAWVLLSHYHDDHVEGLPALPGLLAPGAPLRIAGPSDMRHSLRKVLRERLPGVPAGSMNVYSLSESLFRLWPDLAVSVMMTRHPGPTLAFRFDYKGRSLVYCPDNEIESEAKAVTDYQEKLGRFMRGADVLLHDARFLDADYGANKNQGHSCPRLAMELAVREGVRSLVLFHMDSKYPADAMAAALEGVRKQLSDDFCALAADLAQPGSLIGV